MALVTTPNLHLPQWTPNEKPSYMVDFNNAFKNIDNGFVEITTKVDSANQTASNAMAEASSATSQAQEAMQTANQAQEGLNSHIQELIPSTINLTINKSTSRNIDIQMKMSHNAACATLHLYITYNEQTTSEGSEVIGSVVFPDNITLGAGVSNHIYLATCGDGPYIDLAPTGQRNIYTITAGFYKQYPANSHSGNIGTWPAYYARTARNEKTLVVVV